jgi:hypothetical protein
MQSAAIPELTNLYNSGSVTEKVRCITVLAELPISSCHELLFNAVEHPHPNVSLSAIQVLQINHKQLPLHILIALLDKLIQKNKSNSKPCETLNSATLNQAGINHAVINHLVLMCGQTLTLYQAQHVEALSQHGNKAQDSVFVLHCIAALAKAGVQERRKQFSAYLQSLTSNREALELSFKLASYIRQPWLMSSLKVQLDNTLALQGFSESLPSYPNQLRVCDKAATLIMALAGPQKLAPSHSPLKHKRFSSEELYQLKQIADK